MEFTKMEAAGNDFVVFNGFKYDIKEYDKLAIKSCDRHFSVGADGILVCKKSNIADIEMIYFNSDGSRGEMCGNGIRCFSKYVYEEGLVKKELFTIETLAGIRTVHLEIENDNVKTISVNMGRPLGCGTGSCASVVIGNLIGKLGDMVHVKTEGGELQVLVENDYEIYMKGGANRICNGVFLNI